MTVGSSERQTKPLITLLIVEDNYYVRVLLRDWLADILPACRLLEAGDGEEAIEIALEERPTGVLMDIGLPRLNGLEATRRLLAAWPEARIVLMSHAEAARHTSEGLAAGAKAVISKRDMDSQLIPLLADLLRPPDPR